MSAALNPAAEIDRLRKTIMLSEESVRISCDLRNKRHALGETIEGTTARWNCAGDIETAAKAARKAARKALAGLAVFPDVWSDEEILAKIEEARSTALALKAALDAGSALEAEREAERSNRGESK